MRLINADALIKFIENRYDITWEDDYEGGIKDACTDILEEINKMPTIDPQRKTGRWTKAYDGNDGHVKCTGCFKTYDWISQAQYYNYCPNCGSYNGGDKDDQC